MSRIIFIQPAYAHYRYELFQRLHANHDVLFVFVREKSTYPANQGPNPSWKINYLKGWGGRKWISLTRLIFRYRPQVIISSINTSYQTIVSLLAGGILNTPVLLWSPSWGARYHFMDMPRWKVFLHEKMFLWTLFTATALMVSGTRSRKYHESLVNDKKKIFTTFQSTVDLRNVVQNSNSSLDQISQRDAINILYLSRIVEYKGLDVLVRAFSRIEKKIDGVFLLVVGDGPFRKYCEELAIELHVQNIKFFGSVLNEESWKFYLESDVFVLPCSGKKSDEEWGLVINEATSMGLPIVTTEAVGAVGDLVRNGENGYVVKPGDEVAMQLAIEKFLSNLDLRRSFGNKSREFFEEINSYDKMYEGFDAAIAYVSKNGSSE